MQKDLSLTKIRSIHFLIVVTTLSSCVISKKSTDNSVIKTVSNDTGVVKEAAEFAVAVTFDKVKKDFNANDVEDAVMRKKIITLGSSVYVTYKSGSDFEIPDSNVTFKTITLFGVTEVIYDFATIPRQITNNTKNRRDYYFVRLSDRIYYRRRQVPMM